MVVKGFQLYMAVCLTGRLHASRWWSHFKVIHPSVCQSIRPSVHPSIHPSLLFITGEKSSIKVFIEELLLADSILSYSRPLLFPVSLREVILWQSMAENKLHCFLECSHTRKTQISLNPISDYLWYEIEALNKWEMSNLSCWYHLQKFGISCYNVQRHPAVGFHTVSIPSGVTVSL